MSPELARALEFLALICTPPLIMLAVFWLRGWLEPERTDR